MTEEIIRECKNCDALGIDSEIGVYYCCLSHRQDDLPKEFTCDDFTPNKQLLCLEQENKELKDEFEPYKHPDVVTLLTNWRTGELDRIHNKIANERDTYRSVLEEISLILDELKQQYDYMTDYSEIKEIQNKINEVLQ